MRSPHSHKSIVGCFLDQNEDRATRRQANRQLHYLLEQRISLSIEIAFSLAPDLLLRNSNGGCKVQVGVKAKHILDQRDLPRQVK